MRSPEGAWHLLWLYWRPDRLSEPVTRLATQTLAPRQGWAETPDDPDYNLPIRHPHPFPADRMRRGDSLYDICAVTDQNVERTPGEGSAIFVHLWRRPRWPTAGCIAFRRTDLEWILTRWRADSRLVIRRGGGLF